MKVYRCKKCHYLYREEYQNQCFDDLGEGYKCPRCDCSKRMFELIEDS